VSVRDWRACNFVAALVIFGETTIEGGTELEQIMNIRCHMVTFDVKRNVTKKS